MAAIVLEGPDGSGKTSLAYALIGSIGTERGQYIKSPAGKSTVWEDNYNYWTIAMQGRNPNKLVVLDRTPEISESVYGSVVRYNCRLDSPMRSLSSLYDPNVAVVMCTGSMDIEGEEHFDPMGNDITEYQSKVLAGYEMVTSLLRNHGVDMYLWDRHDMSLSQLLMQSGLHTKFRSHFLHSLIRPRDFWSAHAKGKEIINEHIG